MISKFVKRFDDHRNSIREHFAKKRPESYDEIVDVLVKALADDNQYDSPDPERVICTNWGDYEGTLFYLIGESGNSPGTAWVTWIAYGSCSHCDVLEGLWGVGEPTSEQLDGYMDLARHLVQNMKQVGWGAESCQPAGGCRDAG